MVQERSKYREVLIFLPPSYALISPPPASPGWIHPLLKCPSWASRAWAGQLRRWQSLSFIALSPCHGLPLWLSWKRIHLQCRRPGFNPWVWKIPWRRERLPTPVFWPGEFHGLYSPWGLKEDTIEWLSLHFTSSPCHAVYRSFPRWH